jgi:hypothetical protein
MAAARIGRQRSGFGAQRRSRMHGAATAAQTTGASGTSRVTSRSLARGAHQRLSGTNRTAVNRLPGNRAPGAIPGRPRLAAG